ncbi:BREX-1 system phosphatase PglZ type B [Deinococcus fonticola]|uniref:BREX-1 system phosphatase PglZ type B n=1 Tax=Deinococcus fonticola TaxID=2528713 RepID=UPI0010753A20|nr:BREX-1 system phosphatase PglZ type B [Deinococcus fonticola]
MTIPTDITVLDALEQALQKAGTYNPGDVVPPVCLLWPDGTGEWRAAAEALRQRRPVLTLGKYDPATQTGPAVWIRTVVDPCAGTLPVVYLPGVSHDQLRDEHIPEPLAPLVELQYRGAMFERRDRNDWTVASFLNRQGEGLGVEVASSARPVVAGHLETLLERKVSDLRQRAPLTPGVLDQLSYPDLARELLTWLSEPESPVSGGLQAALESEYGVDLTSGPATVAAQLAGRGGSLAEAWERYTQSPGQFPGVRERLATTGPTPGPDWILEQAEVWPQVNEFAEKELAAALEGLHGQASALVREGLQVLEGRHGARRDVVWSALRESPLAGALAPLLELAQRTTETLSGSTPQELADSFASNGYQVDQAVVQVLAGARTDLQRQILGGVVRAPYLEWLERVNKIFRQAVEAQGTLPMPPSHGWSAAPGLAVIFVDGLRFDLAAQLASHLKDEEVRLDWQFSTVPTITKSAKPAVAPVGSGIEPLNSQELTLGLQGKTQTAALLRGELARRGFLSPPGSGLPDPAGAAWLESGDFDSMGHSQGLRLASRIEDELDKLRETIVELLSHGFREVRVITDHGWLLVPGSLHKVELPGSQTLFKKERCALLKSGNISEYGTLPWSWDHAVDITLAPTISSFEAGGTYAHGGLSLQESVIPVLTIKREGAPVPVAFTSIRWVNNRCKVEVTGGTGLMVDLRRKATDPESSLITARKSVGEDGQVSLLVPADDLEGEAAILVALRDGQVVRQQTVIVGDEG